MKRTVVGLAVAATAIALLAAEAAAHTFRYRAPAGTRSVAVAGSFNNWSTSAHPMTDADGDGVWEASVDLRPGTYQYKFVVNGSDWKPDPENAQKAPDGLGGENSIVEVTAEARPATTAPSGAAPAGGVCPCCGQPLAAGRVVRSAAASAPAGAAPAAGAAPGGHVFRFRAPAGTRSVAVAGSFNNWSASAHPMTDADGDGVWEATVNLPAGRHQYKFVVNGSDWKPDPENAQKADDGFGGVNSVVEVAAASAPAGTAPAAGAAPGGHVFRFRAPAGTRSVAVAGSFNNWSASAHPMTDADGDGVWEATVNLPAGRHQYKFVVNGSDWKPDPENAQKADDGFGGVNSVVEIR